MARAAVWLGIWASLNATALAWSPVLRAGFEVVIYGFELSLVAFIEPSTGSCKSLEPEWLEASKQRQIPLLSIDCTKETELCKEQDVNSYPAIRLFRKGGKFVRYRGPRKAADIVAFIDRSKLPELSVVGQKNITFFQTIDHTVFITYLAPDDTNMKSNIGAVAARNFDRFAFGLTTDARVAGSMKVPVPAIVCYQPEEEANILPLPATTHEIEAFIEKTTAPLVGEMTRRNELKYLKSGKSLVYIISTSENERSELRQSLKPLAKKYNEYLSFVTIDAVEYEAMVHALGVKVGKLASLAVQNPLLGQVFLYSENQKQPITPEVVEGFVLDIVQGKVIPAGDEGPVGGQSHQEL